MMNYEMFKGIVETEFKNLLTGEFKEMEVVFSKTNKVNRECDSITLIPKTGSDAGKIVSPAIYINDMYEAYKNYENINMIMKDAAEKVMKNYEHGKKLLPIVEDKDAIKGNIVFQLINAAQNESLLKNVPHKNFEDLAIIYRIVVQIEPGEGISSSIITNPFAKALGLSEDELFKLAADNTKNLLPIKIRSMDEIMRELFKSEDMPDEVIDMMLPDVPEEMKMYVITNEYNLNGAGAMLYEKEVGELADKLGTDLLILPSSLHEVIAVPDHPGNNLEEMADMVYQINMSQVDIADRLSNQVYKYNRSERKLSLATDTPHKRLDGQTTSVAEPKMIYETGKTKR